MCGWSSNNRAAASAVSASTAVPGYARRLTHHATPIKDGHSMSFLPTRPLCCANGVFGLASEGRKVFGLHGVDGKKTRHWRYLLCSMLCQLIRRSSEITRVALQNGAFGAHCGRPQLMMAWCGNGAKAQSLFWFKIDIYVDVVFPFEFPSSISVSHFLAWKETFRIKG